MSRKCKENLIPSEARTNNRNCAVLVEDFQLNVAKTISELSDVLPNTGHLSLARWELSVNLLSLTQSLPAVSQAHQATSPTTATSTASVTTSPATTLPATPPAPPSPSPLSDNHCN